MGPKSSKSNKPTDKQTTPKSSKITDSVLEEGSIVSYSSELWSHERDTMVISISQHEFEILKSSYTAWPTIGGDIYRSMIHKNSELQANFGFNYKGGRRVSVCATTARKVLGGATTPFQGHAQAFSELFINIFSCDTQEQFIAKLSSVMSEEGTKHRSRRNIGFKSKTAKLLSDALIENAKRHCVETKSSQNTVEVWRKFSELLQQHFLIGYSMAALQGNPSSSDISGQSAKQKLPRLHAAPRKSLTATSLKTLS